MAVNQGLNDAEFNLAGILKETDGLRAIRLYRKAADAGMEKAQLAVSNAYSKGAGVDRNLSGGGVQVVPGSSQVKIDSCGV